MRIVSLLPSATELLFAVGAGDAVVGVTHECDHPPAARRLPALTADALATAGRPPAEVDRHIRAALHRGSAIYALDEDLLNRLAPDLIVTQELCAVCAVGYAEVEQAARRLPGPVPVLSLEPRTLDDVLATVLTVGRAAGREEQARAVAAGLRRRLDAVARLPRPDPAPRVACIEWTDPLMVGGHWVPDMVELAGGTDVGGRAGEPSVAVSWDAVLAADPEVMLLMPCGYGLEEARARAGDVTGRPGFDGLACAREGRVAAVDGSAFFNRPGPRLVDGVEILAAVLRTAPVAALPPGAAWVR